ncbi:MAG: PmoA family protein [Tepidisphaeraceae bacterium]
MRLTHDLGQSIAIQLPGQAEPRWKYVYGGKPKPFFHPLCTPSGQVLTLFEPWDHVWHRGLWFTIKYVNKENFWEERESWGTQRTVGPITINQDGDQRVSVTCRQEWVRPSGDVIFDEARAFDYLVLAPDAYAIDFRTTLTPCADVLLDRTPFTTWGGYGGLTFRGNRNWYETQLTFADGSTSNRPTPVRSKWCDLSGKIDGGDHLFAGVAIFDSPNNRRHPTPWYGGTGIGHYFNAAFLFDEPMSVKAGEPIHFDYRVFVHDGIATVDRLNAEYDKWQSSRAD